MLEEWPEDDIEKALAQLRQRHPALSAHLFRILLRTATKEVAPPDLPALVECTDKIIKALQHAG
ncbi:MAG: hypothetical protein U0984_05250 [Prosthecobacter sp.]|nr:hypothetical protein [Prosthecobacter sp.]